MISIADGVEQDLRRTVVVPDDDIGVAVVIEISKRRAPADVEVSEHVASLVADIVETAVAEVAEELLALP